MNGFWKLTVFWKKTR